MRVARLRYAYAVLLASALLFLGTGDFRAFLLSLMTLLLCAVVVESVLHVFDAVPVLLALSLAVLAFATSWAYPDPLTRYASLAYVLVSMMALSLLR